MVAGEAAPAAQAAGKERAGWRPARRDASVLSGTSGSASGQGQQQGRQVRQKTGDTDQDEEMAKVDSKGGSRRRGGRRTKAKADDGQERKLVTKDGNLKKLLVTIMKLTLQNTQQVKLIKSVVCMTFLIADGEQGNKVVQAMDVELKTWLAALKKWRETEEEGDTNQHPGSPTPTIFVAMIESLTSLEIGAKNKAEILKLNMEDKDLVEEAVQICRVDKIKEREASRLTISMVDGSIKQAVKAALLQVGAECRTGPQPVGYMEDELSNWIRALSID